MTQQITAQQVRESTAALTPEAINALIAKAIADNEQYYTPNAEVKCQIARHVVDDLPIIRCLDAASFQRGKYGGFAYGGWEAGEWRGPYVSLFLEWLDFNGLATGEVRPAYEDDPAYYRLSSIAPQKKVDEDACFTRYVAYLYAQIPDEAIEVKKAFITKAIHILKALALEGSIGIGKTDHVSYRGYEGIKNRFDDTIAIFMADPAIRSHVIEALAESTIGPKNYLWNVPVVYKIADIATENPELREIIALAFAGVLPKMVEEERGIIRSLNQFVISADPSPKRTISQIAAIQMLKALKEAPNLKRSTAVSVVDTIYSAFTEPCLIGHGGQEISAISQAVFDALGISPEELTTTFGRLTNGDKIGIAPLSAKAVIVSLQEGGKLSNPAQFLVGRLAGKLDSPEPSARALTSDPFAGLHHWGTYRLPDEAKRFLAQAFATHGKPMSRAVSIGEQLVGAGNKTYAPDLEPATA